MANSATENRQGSTSADAEATVPSERNDVLGPPSLKRLKFLALRLATVKTPARNHNQATAIDQLNRYITDAGDRRNATSALELWDTRNEVYSKLVSIAEDLLSAPASQAYVE